MYVHQEILTGLLVSVYHQATMVAGQILSAVVDGVIAFTLCYYLRKRRTGMKRQVIN
jgi:hypothetical protein